jgi:SSS family transporter
MRGELLTAYQLLRQRFNPTVQRTASGLFLITRTLADGLRLMLTAILLREFTGLPIEWSVLIMGLSTILYTFLGGMQAVIWTDLIQFVIYILGAVVAGLFLIALIPGGFETILQKGDAERKFDIINLSTDPRQPLTLWTGLIGGAFFTMASHGADQLMVQRYLCSRNLTEARVAVVLSGVVVFVQFLLFLFIGVGLFVFYQQADVAALPEQDEAFGAFIVAYLPQGVVGIVIAAVLAAAMSTLSSSLNSSANAFIVDFWRPWLRPNQPEAHYLLMARLMTAGFGVAQIVVALAGLSLQGQQGVVMQVLTVAGFTTGMILGLFVLGLLRRPVSSRAALIGLVGGFTAVLLVWLPTVLGEPYLAWPWFAPIGATYTIAIALIVEVLTHAAGPSGNRSAESRVEPAR